ncbi:DUF488 domain-containing protein [Verticiella sediminum]|uniref:DUF488 domain-containing protein n=1 Tax=Verticiella sediminum TaxID=1247510 RepID=A0A556AB50_9BURK|nr:DUF488 domain-containing protein [Verticiella sediminum]TSH90103.1 DUF488 domain-containing protein [Verticiella sediminum]
MPIASRDIRTKRIYEAAVDDDGARVLVDRLWPRGIRKADAHLHAWMKDVAPSNELRRWFGHDPERWEAFRTRYRAELEHAGDALRPLLDLAREGRLTLLYGARDEKHNQAVVLAELLKERL